MVSKKKKSIKLINKIEKCPVKYCHSKCTNFLNLCVIHFNKLDKQLKNECKISLTSN